ncbi:MAG: tripartite tricarboxylate transporter substrate binding protein [Proteobacteria bacterium]|nr:tripartite tricarboxylate transporter substrate binding protein [Pseudomonadota bacterium]
MTLRRHLLAVALAALPLASWAAWPERPITIVVPAAAGGTTDIAARVLAEKMGKDLGTAIVVENKGGGGGSIGTAQVARAKPDGYTLLMGNIGPIAINFSLYKQLSYKESDLRGITNVISVPNVLVVHADSPVHSVQELIKLAKTRRLNVATSGVGQSPHMSSEMFRQKAGIEVTLVPFPGAAPAVTALLGQQVDFMIDNLPSSIPHIKSGKFRALAITSGQRSAQLPDVPTMTEAGVPMQVTAWFGLLAPAGTPDAMVDRLQQSARKAMQTPEVRQRFAELGGVPGGETPAEYDAFIAQERKSWAQIVKAAGLSLE